jgi:NADP-dependent 3-hydroxy acid dehydrogenase YdfG
MSGIKGKVVLVTGASSGIGWETAMELGQNGAKLMLTARRKERLQELTDKLLKQGIDADFLESDVTKADEFKAVAQKTIEKYQRIDVLFNNAGVMPLSMMDKLKTDEWERMVDVNIKGVLNGIAAVLPSMLENQKGHIINVSSIAGLKVFPGSAVYSATKFAVNAISEGLRQELGHKGIRVTNIMPGAVKTELAQSITDEDIINMFKENLSSMEPLTSDAIARAVKYAIEQPDDVDVNDIVVRPRTSMM